MTLGCAHIRLWNHTDVALYTSGGPASSRVGDITDRPGMAESRIPLVVEHTKPKTREVQPWVNYVVHIPSPFADAIVTGRCRTVRGPEKPLHLQNSRLPARGRSISKLTCSRRGRRTTWLAHIMRYRARFRWICWREARGLALTVIRSNIRSYRKPRTSGSRLTRRLTQCERTAVFARNNPS